MSTRERPALRVGLGWAREIALVLSRALLLLLLVAAGTLLLMRLAPGYFSQSSELDAAHAVYAQGQAAARRRDEGSVADAGARTARAWLHGDLGRSREYDLPVAALVRSRLPVTARLLGTSLLAGWLLAFALALPAAALPRAASLLGLPSTLLLAIPTGALATVCLLADLQANQAAPAAVLALVVAARDFQFVRRLLSDALAAPHILHARAAGLRFRQVVRGHVLPAVLPQLGALATLSVVTALSALVPVEVLFDLHGVAALAWNAANNRDLPVLLAVTLLMAATVALAGLLASPSATAAHVSESA